MSEHEPRRKTIREYPSYWSIVWEQFRKQRTNMIALQVIAALAAVAIYAPMISSKMPFWWQDDGGLTFPWFRSLLFNRNVYGSGVDIFFNLVGICLPVFLGTWAWLTRRARGVELYAGSRLRTRFLLGWVLLVLVGFGVLMSFDPRLAVPEYREMAAAGAEGAGWFPPLRIQYDDTLHGIEGTGIRHLLGTDGAGRDIFVRTLFGTRVSLSVGVIAVSIYLTIGILLGSTAGYFGGRTDIVIQRLIEIFLCFPSFFLILTFIGFLDQPSIAWVMIIIGVVSWTGPAQLVRGEFLRIKNLDFVSAARACGLSNRRIIFRHILPNALGPVLVNATFGIASAVLVEASISFLGFGDPTLPSWGRVLAYGRETGDTRMMVIAGMCIFVTVSTFNLAGEGMRDALDPRLRQ